MPSKQSKPRKPRKVEPLPFRLYRANGEQFDHFTEEELVQLGKMLGRSMSRYCAQHPECLDQLAHLADTTDIVERIPAEEARAWLAGT